MNMETAFTALLFLTFFGLNSSTRKHIYVKNKMTWSEAQTYCRTNYDDLSTVTIQDLQPLCQNPEIQELYVYIGLQKDPVVSSRWMWTDGSTSSLNEWDYNQGFIGENCGAMRMANFKMHDFDCSTKLSFYCMLNMDLIQENRTWEEALIYCAQNNMSLASINSSTIMDKVMDMSTEAQTPHVWIGLRFLVAHWFWVNGADLGYKAWSEGELKCPAMNQRCGALDRDGRAWKPKNCQESLNFFCSYKRKQTQIVTGNV